MRDTVVANRAQQIVSHLTRQYLTEALKNDRKVVVVGDRIEFANEKHLVRGTLRG